jgi:signal transduction histidine kinase
VQDTARSLASGPARTADVPHGDPMRLASAPIVRDGRRVGTLVTSLGLESYERSERSALIASVVLAVVLFAVMLMAARWLLLRALAPVAQMTQLAEQWSLHDVGRRFAAGEPHDELTELAATLDRLLDRLAASLRHEQRFSAELSHELRTPLARIAAEAELALRRERTSDDYREALAAIQRNAREMTRTVDALVAAARSEGAPRGRSDVVAVTRAVADAAEPLAAERHVDIAVDAPPAALVVGVEADLLERILAPVVENACRYASAGVRLDVARAGARVVVDVRDDGPGVPADERERIFEPGARGTAAGGHDGAGLGLALSRRLARAADGDVRAQASGAGAWFTVDLPAA